MEISIDLDRIYNSIREQQRDLRRPPAWVLMSPLTCYEIQRVEPTDWIYLGTPKTKGARPAIIIMGIPIKEVAWMPDGIVVVTDNFDESWYTKMGSYWVDASVFGESKTYKIKLEDSPLISASTEFSKWSSLFFPADVKAATASGTFTLFEGHPKEPSEEKVHDWPVHMEWDNPVVESQEPDSESIYGKALARARANNIEKAKK